MHLLHFNRNETSFWVGKESLRCWKQFALKRTESANEMIENGDSDSENQRKLIWCFHLNQLCI